LLRENNLDGTLQEIKKLLDDACWLSAKELRARWTTTPASASCNWMRFRRRRPKRAELSEYDWRSDEARQKYEQIKDLLGREMLDQRFAGMKEGAGRGHRRGPSARQRHAQRPQRLVGQALRKGKIPNKISRTSWTSTAVLPENPQKCRELLDSLAKRAAAAQAVPQQPEPDRRPSWMRWRSRHSARRR